MGQYAYADLPELNDSGYPHARGLLDPLMGSIGRLGPSHVRAAAGLVDLGESISLNLPIGFIDPPLFGRAACRHRYVQVGHNTFEDVIDDFNPQAGSQWDGLLHVRAREHGFFDGRESLDAASSGRGIEAWAANGIVGRGVLLDLARWTDATGRSLDPMSGTEITSQDLADCAASQGVDLLPGDILCIRTGWLTAYRALDDEARQGLPTDSVGLRADAATASFVWDNELAAVCADNPALECVPGDPAVGSLHRRLIPMLGTAIAELLDLDELARRCAEIGRWEFLFVSAPLALPGGVSSPSNALAIL
jgi:kynurenine formamidase